MTTSCAECGVTSKGAFIREYEDGRDLCEDCWPGGECERCGRDTERTTLSGTYRCKRCSDEITSRSTSRDAEQHGLVDFEGGDER